VAGLAAWRVTHLLAREDGPADVIARLRARAGAGELGELMDCFDCLSIWVAAPLALVVARRPPDRVVSWLALSGAACVVERVVSWRDEVLDLSGDHDELLRQEENGDDASGAPSAGDAPEPPDPERQA